MKCSGCGNKNSLRDARSYEMTIFRFYNILLLLVWVGLCTGCATVSFDQPKSYSIFRAVSRPRIAGDRSLIGKFDTSARETDCSSTMFDMSGDERGQIGKTRIIDRPVVTASEPSSQRAPPSRHPRQPIELLTCSS